MERIEVNDSLWIETNGAPPDYGDKVIELHSDRGGIFLLAIADIPALITQLQAIHTQSEAQ